MRRRLMTGLLCIALLVGNIAPTGLQVQAAELTSASVTSEAEEVDGENPTDTEKVSELPESTDERENSEKTGENSIEESGEDSEKTGEDSTEESGEDLTQTDEDSIGEGDEDSEKSEENDEEDAVSEENPEKEDSEDTESEETPEETDAQDSEEADETVSENSLDGMRRSVMDTEDDIAGGTYEGITWRIDANGKLTVEGEGDLQGGSWGLWSNYITSAVVNVTGATNASWMFNSCRNLTSVDLSGFDTSSVTDMSYMFYNCNSLTSLDVSNFDTSSVKNMSHMFYGCNSLTSLDVSNFDTSNVKNMSYMFYAYFRYTDSWEEIEPSLTSLDVSSFDTSSVTDMSHMFYGCSSLTSLDVSSLDTSNVTDMSRMFDGCSSLTSLDVSSLDTSSVTNMSGMFGRCSSLTSLDVSSLDTSNVTDMMEMFRGLGVTSLDVSSLDTSNITNMYGMFMGSKLKSLDLSSFNTSNVISMGSMFEDCYGLKSVDVSSFDTSKVERMSLMFACCYGLTSVDVSNFDTGNVMTMNRMFYDCSSLTSVDVSGFDTSNVADMSLMFRKCYSLTSLNLSSFDMHKVIEGSEVEEGDDRWFSDGAGSMLDDCPALTTIYTPYNLTQSVSLPKAKNTDVWYDSEGKKITELPQNLDHSIMIARNKKPEIPDPYITVSKTKTSYTCGETVNTDDIKVTYYGSDGSSRRLSADDYITNVDEINKDMSTPGKKTLVITYEDLTASIELSVTYLLSEDNVSVTLPDTVYTYNGFPQKPVPVVTLTDTSVILSNGTDYTVSYTDNINAGDSAKVIITGQGDYSGTITQTFSIGKARLEIKALDVVLAVGDKAADSDFSYQVVGLAAGDRLAEEPSYTFAYQGMDGDSQASVELSGIDTSKTGIYTITPYGADAGNNYEIVTYTAGTLTIAEERVIYTVTFDLQGKTAKEGTAPANLAGLTGVTAGSLISEPKEIPQAEGYIFAGWYRDQACTKAWNFDADTVQQDTTLYALWLTSAAKTDTEGGITGADLCIQEIPAQIYTGSALKPAVKVYAADGTTLLKAGKDYTIKYYNNIEADTEEEQTLGGTDGILSGNAGGFTDQLAYVTITGKGNYTGTLYSNFHIRQASIADGSGSAAEGVTLKYTEQFVTANKVQKPFSSIKYKKAMKAGTDYTVTLTAQKAYAADGTARTAGEAYDAAGIPKGYSGTFTLTITGKGNYTGTIVKTIYVADKTHLMKNAAITLGKDLKTRSYDEGREIILQPGYYKAETKKYYKVDNSGTISTEPETNANGIYTVKFGKEYLVYGKDYTVSYTNNKAVGTATMTITGMGDYTGSKSVTFKITGTAFNTKNITLEGIKDLTYTGKALTQNKNMVLKTKDGTALVYGKHYTVTYTNNLKKGTAKMTFTAKPDSGYSGSFTQNFKIKQAQLADAVIVTEADISSAITNQGSGTLTYTGTVSYTREGAKPIDRITLRNRTTGAELKAGTDYTVSYANNTAVTTETVKAAGKTPVMKIKGKGNYAGTINITFSISEASLAERQAEGGLKAAATATVFDAKKADTYQYQPKIKVTDGKKTLSAKKDYTVTYENCSQAEVKAYLEALANGTGQNNSLENMQPRAVITAVNGSGYSGSVTAYLEIFGTKLTGSNLYIIVEEKETTYTGAQVTPEVTVYYGNSKAIKAAKNAKITDEGTLTNQEGSYKFIKLKPKTDGGIGNYTLTYGVNIAAGKNKGTVTVTGTGLYGGSVTAKFTIRSKGVYTLE